jgi:hypothetical protein
MVLRFLATCLFLVFGIRGVAHGGGLLDVEGGILQETLQASSNSSRTNTFYSAGLYLPADSRESFYLGAIFGSGSLADKVTSGSTVFIHQDIILAAKYFLDQQRIYSITAGYSILSTASLKDPTISTVETWQGTGYYGKITAAPVIKDWMIGVSLIYYSGTYNRKIVQTVTTVSNHSRTFLVPAFALAYKW